MEGLVIERKFVFQNEFGFSIKTSKNTNDNSQKQLKTANSNSPWAYSQEGLLSEGYFCLRFGGRGGGLIFGKAYFWGAYYQNFAVYCIVVGGTLGSITSRCFEDRT